MVRAAAADSTRASPATLCDVIAGFGARGHRVAIVDFAGGRPTTVDFHELGERIRHTANGLRAMGIGTGSAVALWAPNGIEWVIAYFAALRAGAHVVPIDQQTTATVAAVVLEHAAPAMLLTTAAHRSELAGIRAPPPTYLIEPGSAADPQSWNHWPVPDGGAFPEPRPEDFAALLYTSGTTGTPKAVPLTHGNLAANAAALCAAHLIDANDRVLLPLPLHHTYPFTAGLVTVLATGAAVVFPSGISGPEISAAAHDGEATVLLAVPRLCEALWDSVRTTVEQRGARTARLFKRLLAISIAARRFTGLRIGKRLFGALHERLGKRLDLIGCGGAKLDPTLARRLEGLGWTVLTGYGLTETSPVLTFNDRSHSRLGTEGRALPGVELEIRPVPATEHGAPLDPRHGEIVARGPSVFTGYHENPEATAAAFTADGWFRTGDLGWLDHAGFLHVVGRSKELLVLADGKKVFPEELEKVYASLPLLREIAILEDGGRLAALVVPDEHAIRERGALREAALLREELEEIAARLPPHQRITAYRITRTPLPRTQLGKLKRHLLAPLYAQAGAAESAPADAETSRADAELLARERAGAAWQWLQARYPTRQLTLDTSPQLELQIDSLEWVAITVEIEQRFHLALTGEAVSRILSLRDLLHEIEAAGPAVPATQRPAEPELELPGPAMRAVGALIFVIVRTLMLLFRVRASGLERFASDEPFVIAPNHTSFLDSLALAACLPWHRLRRTFWAGWVGILYTGPVTRFLSRAAQVMPVDPDRDLTAAISNARALLQRGYSIVWFPEGRRSPTGELGPFLGGVGQLLLDTGAAALPTAIRGTYEAWPKQRRLPSIGRRLSVAFGEPLRVNEPNTDGRAAMRISAALEREVRALLEQHAPTTTGDP